MSESPHLLVRRYLESDPAAFSGLVQRYQDLVFRLCYRMLGHRQDAEDATQETFTRMARSLHGWDEQRPLEPWLLKIAGNRCRTLLSRRRRHYSLCDAAEPPCDVADQRQAARQLDEELQRALATMRPEHRDAFLLFHHGELSYGEIAERLGCPLGTVKTWVHRARTELISQLRQRDVLEGNRRAVS
jgi:RNA polymerase sigma-70 factor, ECF subfamily